MTKDDATDDLPMPLPLEIREADEAMQAFFPDGDPTPETPLGAAFIWQAILLNPGPTDPEARSALDKLVVNPRDWHGYSEVAAEMENWAIMQFVIDAEDAPGELAHVKFMPDTGHVMRGFDDAPLPDVLFVTLARFPDGWWRVCGYSRNHVPPASQVWPGRP